MGIYFSKSHCMSIVNPPKPLVKTVSTYKLINISIDFSSTLRSHPEVNEFFIWSCIFFYIIYRIRNLLDSLITCLVIIVGRLITTYGESLYEKKSLSMYSTIPTNKKNGQMDKLYYYYYGSFFFFSLFDHFVDDGSYQIH